MSAAKNPRNRAADPRGSVAFLTTGGLHGYASNHRYGCQTVADVTDPGDAVQADPLAARGWQLWLAMRRAGKREYYADAGPNTRVKDFSPDGLTANCDHRDDGFFECTYLVRGDRLRYVGTIEQSTGKYVRTGEGFGRLLGDTAAEVRAEKLVR